MPTPTSRRYLHYSPIAPFDLVTSAPAALRDNRRKRHGARGLRGLSVINTAPSLALPNDFSVEATSSAGAEVTYAVTASDAQDGDLTASVVCTPASGTTFALGLPRWNAR